MKATRCTRGSPVSPVLVAVLLTLALGAVLTPSAYAQVGPPGDFDVLGRLQELLNHLPQGISDSLRGMLGELLPAVWDELKPDLPGLFARGFLMLLGMFAQWWMAGLDPHVAGDAVRDSLLVQTPAAWTYSNPDVQQMQGEVKLLAAAILVPAVSLGALGVYLSLTDPQTVLRGAIVSVFGVFAAEHIGRWLLDFGNAACVVLLGGGRGLPGWDAMKATADAAAAPTATQSAITAGAAVLVYGLASALMLAVDVAHLAGTVALYVFLPLAAACYALPFLQRFARAALMAMAVAAVVKAPAVVVLRVGAALLGGASGSVTDSAGVVFAVFVAWGVAGIYGAFLAKGALFAGAGLLSEGRQAVRTVSAAAREPRHVIEYRRERDARRAMEGQGGGAAVAGSPPTMLTHAHTHGHLLHRGAGAPAAPPGATSTTPQTKP